MQPTSRRALARTLLALQGLLGWKAPGTDHPQGRPWREELLGAEGIAQALQRLGAVQLDPVTVVERNHHLVFWNRVTGYTPQGLEALYPPKRVSEGYLHARCLIPTEGWALIRRERARLRVARFGPELIAAAALIRAKLSEGPLPSRDLDSGERVQGDWELQGRGTKATSQALLRLWEAGEVVVAFRERETCHYALAESWQPTVPSGSLAERLGRTLSALGVIYRGHPALIPWGESREKLRQQLSELEARGQLIPLAVPGLSGYSLAREHLALLQAMESAEVQPETFLLPPLDNLLWSRRVLRELFGFDYRWEIYLPAARRRYGPYALAALEGDRFVARVDARREGNRLAVRQVFWETDPSTEQRARLESALANLASWVEGSGTGAALSRAQR